ncbi:MAG: hypothetical protein AB1758_34960, partial [Candidatus Eremiobacterota bacterium]
EVQTLERIHQSARRILVAPHPYVALNRHPELMEQVQLMARSPAIATAVTGLMDNPTRDGLADYLARPESLELLVYEPLAEAVSNVEELEFLTLQVLYAMCRSDSITLERRLKQFDEGRLRQMLRSRLQALLESRSPHTRAVAVRLLATAEEVRDRNDRLIHQYELNRALQDEDATVAEAASDAMTLLALDPVVPLPSMAEARRVATAEAVRPAAPTVTVEETRVLASDDVGLLVAELRRWVVDRAAPVPSGLNPEQAKRAERMRELADRLKGPDAQPNEGAMQQLAVYFAGLNRALDEPELEGTRRYFCFLPPRHVAALRGAVFDSWKVFAFSQGMRLSDLIAQTPPGDLMLDYRFFLEEHGRELTDRFEGVSPFLGGAGQPLTVYMLAPDESFGVWRRKTSSFVEARREEAPYFVELLERVDMSEIQLQLPRVLRLTRAGGLPLDELETHLPVFPTERIVEPWTTEVFQPARYRFAPLLHKMSLRREQLGSEEDDWDDFEALLGLLQGRPSGQTPEPPPAPVPVPVPVEVAPAPVVEPGPWAPEAPRPGLKELAASLARLFDLPEQYTKQVVNILLEIGSDSVYDL